MASACLTPHQSQSSCLCCFSPSLLCAVGVSEWVWTYCWGQETALPLFVVTRLWSYLLLSSKHVLHCPDSGAPVIYSGLTSDAAPQSAPSREAGSFPYHMAEGGSIRNQDWHLLHVVLGPWAVSCSSMGQTCLLLHRRVWGKQQTLERGGDGHHHWFLIIKHLRWSRGQV